MDEKKKTIQEQLEEGYINENGEWCSFDLDEELIYDTEE